MRVRGRLHDRELGLDKVAAAEQSIGGYRIGQPIGHGAMGAVYRGTAPDGSAVAVKLLHVHLTAVGEYVSRFRREAALARKLAHPNVVRILDSGEDDDQHFIVMEYVEGETLTDRLAQSGIGSPELHPSPGQAREGEDVAPAVAGPPTLEQPEGGRRSPSGDPGGNPVHNLPIPDVLRILRQVAGVLQAAADIGLVHRDLKPQNILIDKRGNAKVLDFGLAKDTEALASFMSMTGQSIGTPPYMSPEQCEGRKEIDVRSDLYSLGATAYQMLTGRPPFPGPTTSAYARQHLEEVPAAVCNVNPQVTRNLSQVVDRLLAKKPEDRHQTPAELIEDLNRVERGEVPLKRYKPKRMRRYGPRQVAAIAAVAVLLCLAGVGGWLAWKGANASAVIEETVSAAEFGANRGELDEALSTLDRLISEHQAERPELVKPACELRDQLRRRKVAQEQRRREEREGLVAQGDKALTDGSYDRALALYEQARAVKGLGEDRGLAGKIETARGWKQDNETKAQQQAEIARRNADRKREAEEAERQRRLDYDKALAAAQRFLEDGDEDTLEQAREQAGKARELARSEDEIEPAVTLQDAVGAALAQRRPYLAVVDFTISPGVSLELTGDAVADGVSAELPANYRRVTRSQIDKALRELRFQASDLVDPDKVQALGKQIGAEYLVTGRVTQIGDVVRVFAELFKVDTGAVRQDADNTATSLREVDTAFFREIAAILGMTDDEKRVYLDERRNYPKHLSEGKALMGAARYAEAARAFETARRAKRTPEVEALLATAREKADEQRILAERKAAHDLAVAEGSRLLREEKWAEAEAAYRRALGVQGWEDSQEAQAGLTKALGGAARAAFDGALDEGNRLVTEQRWKEAEAAFARAGKVPGYEESELAASGLAVARIGQALSAAEAAKERGDWEAAARSLGERPREPHVDERLAALWRRAEALLREADEHLTPRLRVISMLDGREMDGGTVVVSSAGRAASRAETPCTLELAENQVYTITVTLPPRGTRRYSTFEQTARADWRGERELRAEIQEQRLPPDLVTVAEAKYAPLDGLAEGSREAQERQREAVETLGLPLEVKSRKTGVVFRLVPPGTFAMGDGGDRHSVTLTKPIYVGKFEVTQGQWEVVMGSNPSHFDEAGEDAPVESVSWEDCQEFCGKLCTLEGVPEGTYRLLTEAEWEYSCRGGTESAFCYGDDLDSSMANFDGDYPYGGGKKGVYRKKTVAVGQFRPNAWGLYDMHGNVWEWCQDWYGDYPSGSATDPKGPSGGSCRVDRGGGWFSYARFCRSANRYGLTPVFRYDFVGFRLLRAAPE